MADQVGSRSATEAVKLLYYPFLNQNTDKMLFNVKLKLIHVNKEI